MTVIVQDWPCLFKPEHAKKTHHGVVLVGIFEHSLIHATRKYKTIIRTANFKTNNELKLLTCVNKVNSFIFFVFLKKK